MSGISVLVDRHHAGLFHSLQLLFDRIGQRIGAPYVALYTPQGHEWWDEGYWNFGRDAYGDDRLARQFLDWDGDTYPHTTHDPEFPETAIHGITLGQARAYTLSPGGWDFIVATLQDNQHGFSRFAREAGAQFVVGVGNTGQMIDWGLDPLVLNSSEMPILGRGVTVGQEFDSDGLFARAPITNALRIGSFANCMTSMPCWPLLQEAAHKAGDLQFHGCLLGVDGRLYLHTAPSQRSRHHPR